MIGQSGRGETSLTVGSEGRARPPTCNSTTQELVKANLSAVLRCWKCGKPSGEVCSILPRGVKPIQVCLINSLVPPVLGEARAATRVGTRQIQSDRGKNVIIEIKRERESATGRAAHVLPSGSVNPLCSHFVTGLVLQKVLLHTSFCFTSWV